MPSFMRGPRHEVIIENQGWHALGGEAPREGETCEAWTQRRIFIQWLFWTLLVRVADDWGRFIADPAIIMCMAMPNAPESEALERDAADALDEFEEHKMIGRYVIDGRMFGVFWKWFELITFFQMRPSRLPPVPRNVAMAMYRTMWHRSDFMTAEAFCSLHCWGGSRRHWRETYPQHYGAVSLHWNRRREEELRGGL